MVKTMNINPTTDDNTNNTHCPPQTEEEEFLYEIELNKRIVNRKRRNAITHDQLTDLQNFLKDLDYDPTKF